MRARRPKGRQHRHACAEPAPAQAGAGIHERASAHLLTLNADQVSWIPACAGMTDSGMRRRGTCRRTCKGHLSARRKRDRQAFRASRSLRSLDARLLTMRPSASGRSDVCPCPFVDTSLRLRWGRLGAARLGVRPRLSYPSSGSRPTLMAARASRLGVMLAACEARARSTSMRCLTSSAMRVLGNSSMMVSPTCTAVAQS